MTWKKITAFTIGGILVGGLGAGLIFDDSANVKNLTADLADAEANLKICQDTPATIVEVDNENLDLVLDHVYDNDGSVEYLLGGLDDDEVDQIVDRIVFTNEIKDLAVAELKTETADLLDKEVAVWNNSGILTNMTLDEDEIERIRVQDDDNEVVVTDVDFEDSDADIAVSVNFEQDGIKFVADFNVEIKDGEVDDIELLEIRER